MDFLHIGSALHGECLIVLFHWRWAMSNILSLSVILDERHCSTDDLRLQDVMCVTPACTIRLATRAHPIVAHNPLSEEQLKIWRIPLLSTSCWMKDPGHQELFLAQFYSKFSLELCKWSFGRFYKILPSRSLLAMFLLGLYTFWHDYRAQRKNNLIKVLFRSGAAYYVISCGKGPSGIFPVLISSAPLSRP